MSQALTGEVTRAAARLLWHHGYATAAEVPLACGRRADLLGVAENGDIVLVEVKVSAADLAQDLKWTDYLAWCDRFVWAVPPPLAPRLADERYRPDLAGLVVAEGLEAALLREGGRRPLAAARRRALTIRLARMASGRLMRAADPLFEGFARA